MPREITQDLLNPVVVLGYTRTVSITIPNTASNQANTNLLKFCTSAGRLIIALSQPISIFLPGNKQWLQTNTLLLPPNSSVALCTHHAPIASCHLDALGEDYWLLNTAMQHNGDGIYSDHANGAYLINLISTFIASNYNLNSVLPAFDRFLALEKLRLGQNHFIDARIAETVTSIRAISSENPPNEFFSDQVHLSRNALERLFKKQTGVSIRKYRLWNRQFEAAKNRARGDSLTSAAINAGFADAAHYSKTYRSVIGYSPSNLIGYPTTKFFVE